MQQRARGAHRDVGGHPEQRGGGGQRRVQVGAPDVAPVDQPRDQCLVVQPAHRGQRVHGGSPGDEVDADRLDRAGRQDTERVTEVAEVARHQDVRPRVRVPQPPVRPPQRVQLDVGAVGHERGLVQLHPLDTGLVQLGQQRGVDVEELVKFVERDERVARVAVRFGQKEERHRPDEHRTGAHAQLGGFPVAGQRRPVGQREAGVRPDLRHEVVVVRVEPLGHLQRRRGLHAARHGEVGLQRAEAEPGEPGRDGADGDGGVQHVVVVGERGAGHLLQPGLVQAAPGVGAQPTGHLPQFGLTGAGGPIVLQGAFEFPVRPDAGPAEDGRSDAWGRAGQRSLLASSTAWHRRPAGRGAQARGGAACGHPGISSAGPSRETPDSRAHRRCAHRWQVFGLAGVPGREGRYSYAPSLPRLTVQCVPGSPGTAFVPTHRCGAVPDSHRVPSRLVHHHARPRPRPAAHEPPACLSVTVILLFARMPADPALGRIGVPVDRGTVRPSAGRSTHGARVSRTVRPHTRVGHHTHVITLSCAFLASAPYC